MRRGRFYGHRDPIYETQGLNARGAAQGAVEPGDPGSAVLAQQGRADRAEPSHRATWARIRGRAARRRESGVARQTAPGTARIWQGRSPISWAAPSQTAEWSPWTHRRLAANQRARRLPGWRRGNTDPLCHVRFSVRHDGGRWRPPVDDPLRPRGGAGLSLITDWMIPTSATGLPASRYLIAVRVGARRNTLGEARTGRSEHSAMVRSLSKRCYPACRSFRRTTRTLWCNWLGAGRRCLRGADE